MRNVFGLDAFHFPQIERDIILIFASCYSCIVDYFKQAKQSEV